MPDIYEFHVGGLIGPVIQSALPELISTDNGHQTKLFGTAAEPADVHRLLTRLTDSGLIANHILLSNQARWDDRSPKSDAPVTPGASSPADDYASGPGDSAPRQS